MDEVVAAMRKVFAGDSAVRWDPDALKTLIRGAKWRPWRDPAVQKKSQEALDLWLSRVEAAPQINAADAPFVDLFKKRFQWLKGHGKPGDLPWAGTIIGLPPK
ncbi:hypothetical protein FRB99_007539 [Tulasnella sp. 403]|nr:hypothetical protein FRB99_007539 [Tulasnella sp. 403]